MAKQHFCSLPWGWGRPPMTPHCRCLYAWPFLGGNCLVLGTGCAPGIQLRGHTPYPTPVPPTPCLGHAHPMAGCPSALGWTTHTSPCPYHTAGPPAHCGWVPSALQLGHPCPRATITPRCCHSILPSPHGCLRPPLPSSPPAVITPCCSPLTPHSPGLGTPSGAAAAAWPHLPLNTSPVIFPPHPAEGVPGAGPGGSPEPPALSSADPREPPRPAECEETRLPLRNGRVECESPGTPSTERPVPPRPKGSGIGGKKKNKPNPTHPRAIRTQQENPSGSQYRRDRAAGASREGTAPDSSPGIRASLGPLSTPGQVSGGPSARSRSQPDPGTRTSLRGAGPPPPSAAGEAPSGCSGGRLGSPRGNGGE